ncbi:MAG: hypothetical protein H6R18_1702 [Proteobacteria bacterium]|nr:hypothetical protein [Pseudomonadota bacterium]
MLQQTGSSFRRKRSEAEFRGTAKPESRKINALDTGFRRCDEFLEVP